MNNYSPEELDAIRALKVAHPGASWGSQGDQWLVGWLEQDDRTVIEFRGESLLQAIAHALSDEGGDRIQIG